MDVTLSLKNWKVEQDDESKLPRIKGAYSVMMGEKEIATQSFNDGYNAKNIPFSGEAMEAIMAAEVIIKAELQKMLS